MRFRPLLLAVAVAAVSCGGDKTARAPAPAAAPAATPPPIDVDAQGGTGKRGPGDLYNACERIWCLTHQRNYALDHFLAGHVGWILHDDAHGDVFLPRDRPSGSGFPNARAAALRLCGQHLHPAFLGSGPLKKAGYRVALGYNRAHFATYGIRVPECCLNAEGWGFLHSGSPREYRFGDKTSAEEMALSGWQKAVASRPSSPPPSGS